MTYPFPAPRQQATADGSDTLYSPRFKQTYHSTHGALTETQHVFVEGTGVADRLAAGEATHILEVGFGTGLNFWATVQARQGTGAALRYVALEQDLLPAETLSGLNHNHFLPEIAPLRKSFLRWRADLPHFPGQASQRFTWTAGSLHLTLILGEATTAPIPTLGFQAIYQDAFSPEANPELWTPAFFARLYEVTASGGCLGTYSVKGTVRRALESVGYRVERRPGPPGKREVLRAVRP